MKTDSAKEWLKENDYPDAMIRTRGNEVLFRTSNAMQAYAEQQVNIMLSGIIEQVESYPMSADEKETLLMYLEYLKIKQP